MTGLYIHIPFCRKICHYCDFYKMVSSSKYQETFISYLLKDLDLSFKKYQPHIDTIYIGGGTPSCLSSSMLIKLFSKLESFIDLKQLQEFTVETNVEDISQEILSIFRRFNVTRISIGIQSFNSKNWRILGRKNDFSDVCNKVNLLIENGFTNYSFDLIYAIPNETLKDVEEDLRLMLKLNPKHLSTYSLIIEDKTIINYQIQQGRLAVIDEETDASMYQMIKTILTEHNFLHYETSNFALKGYESKHNLIYWNCDNYLAIGPSASSLIGNMRFTKVSSMKTYYQMLDNEQEPVIDRETMSIQRFMEDYIMLGLRKTDGINIEIFREKFQVNIFEQFPKIRSLIENGLLIHERNDLKINEQYQYIANFVINKIL